MKAPIGAAGAFRVNAEALYQQLLEAEIPFHEVRNSLLHFSFFFTQIFFKWYEWVKAQFERKLESFAPKEEKVVEQPPTPEPEPDTIRAKFARFMRRSTTNS